MYSRQVDSGKLPVAMSGCGELEARKSGVPEFINAKCAATKMMSYHHQSIAFTFWFHDKIGECLSGLQWIKVQMAKKQQWPRRGLSRWPLL